MKQRLKKIMFEVSYIIPIFVLHAMIWTKFAESDFEKIALLAFIFPLSCSVGTSIVSLTKQIIDFKDYLKTREHRRVTGIDICPKCNGVGWLDWVEQIKGKNEVKSGNGKSS